MPSHNTNLTNDPHPPPPPPDLSGNPQVPKGNKKTARNGVQARLGSVIVSTFGDDPQMPDQRQGLRAGPGTHHSPNHPQGPQPYHGGAYSPAGPPAAPPAGPPQGPVGPHGPPQSYSGGVYPPGPVAAYPPPPPTAGGYNGPGPLSKNWRQFLMNQKVQVNVEGHGWLVGCVVALINGIQAITKTQVRVSYVDLNRHRREDNFDNDPNYIRPYSNY